MAGQPTKYNDDFPDKVREMIGCTHATMAKNLGIVISTFCVYQNEYKEFSDAVKEADLVTDQIVESMLFKRAVGYDFTETHTEVFPGGEVKVKTIDKKMAPEVIAQIFWLKNRRPDEWREKTEVGGKIDIEFPTIEAAREEAKRRLDRLYGDGPSNGSNRGNGTPPALGTGTKK